MIVLETAASVVTLLAMAAVVAAIDTEHQCQPRTLVTNAISFYGYRNNIGGDIHSFACSFVFC